MEKSPCGHLPLPCDEWRKLAAPTADSQRMLQQNQVHTWLYQHLVDQPSHPPKEISVSSSPQEVVYIAASSEHSWGDRADNPLRPSPN